MATPFMSVTHYPQIQDKGLVLVRGDIIDPNGLSPFEVGWPVLQIGALG